jgi:KDO2-lipid IV(A) lauroyltransferase
MQRAVVPDPGYRKRLRRKRILTFWRRVRQPFVSALDFLLVLIARLAVRSIRRMDPDKCSNFFGRIARRCGPWLPVSRVGRANLAAAFPEKSEAEREAILKGVWENLGRMAGEFLNLDRMWDFDQYKPEHEQGRIKIAPINVDRFQELKDDGKPALIFSAHLANWELAAICARTYGLDTAVLFRPPNMKFMAELIRENRENMMPRLVAAGRAGVFALARELKQGTHLGMLVDQKRRPGVPVRFFGRQCLANPMFAQLAREYECPVRGTRVIRLPGNALRLEMTDDIELPRGSDGRIDVRATMQVITSIIEGWVREHPEQWLWLHRRWGD